MNAAGWTQSLLGGLLVTAFLSGAKAGAEGFTPLVPCPAVILESSTDYPGGGYAVKNLVDGNPRSEYSSASRGTDTFVEFDFGQARPIGAFRHVDRNDPATVARSELIFKDEQGRPMLTLEIQHVNQPGGITSKVLEAPVTARRVRWHVTGLGPHGHGTVGGAELSFFAAGPSGPSAGETRVELKLTPVIEQKDGRLLQPVRFSIEYPYAEATDATLQVGTGGPLPCRLEFGGRQVETSLPASDAARTLDVSLSSGGREMLRRSFAFPPTRRSLIYILPHSHVDIGYTELQTAVEQKQMSNLARGIELARATADYPPGARYRWNAEVVWAVDSYLRTQPADKRQEFIDAVRKGWIGLDAMYGNELTGLCRPEELIRLFSRAKQLESLCGVRIESAMISDVPGYTWGTVSAMAQAGVKYWSIGPNYCDRIGYTMAEYENRPFYWVGPSGRDKVLCWVPYQGYAISHLLRSNLSQQFLFDLMGRLEAAGYPYDILYLRWSGHGDNAVPDPTIPDFVRSWNERFESPRLAIATTAEAFRAFEERYGDRLPRRQGDWTPYWEDGAGSSARETGLNRASAERLVQAETLWALLHPAGYPAERFGEAWRSVLLYSEHTWGAHNSITEPDCDFVKNQWKIKQAFALDGDAQSRRLLDDALNGRLSPVEAAVDVYNTTSWPRTEIVTLSPACSRPGDRVIGSDGEPVASQRLSSGELAFRASAVPPMACCRYTVIAGTPVAPGRATRAEEAALDNGLLRARVDGASGRIVELIAAGIDRNLADPAAGAINDYLFVVGDDGTHPQRCSNVRITIREPGPLVASLLIESDAPGCNRLAREIRLAAGSDHLDILNTVDKQRAQVRGGKPGDWGLAAREAKEGVHFGFGFNVPGGVMRMDIPWAVARPETDQIPGACKNWFTVQRWVDVSNEQDGVTWATIDAPLVEVGAITAVLLGSQTSPAAWISRLEPSQTLYSWAMNNHWHTNYRAYQEGPTLFRYAVRPHRSFSPDAAARFGTGLSQPLIACPAAGIAPAKQRLTVEPASILVTAFKPADGGRGTVVRLFNAGDHHAAARLTWSDPPPASCWISDTSEKPLRPLDGAVEMPAWGVVTIRAE